MVESGALADLHTTADLADYEGNKLNTDMCCNAGEAQENDEIEKLDKPPIPADQESSVPTYDELIIAALHEKRKLEEAALTVQDLAMDVSEMHLETSPGEPNCVDNLSV